MPLLFGDYSLDLERRELRRGSEQISTGPQVFDLLVYLVLNRERVVSKDELLEEVWDGRIVSESTLTTHINAVRRAVGDNGEEQGLVRTVARKGYRFVGQVTEVRTPPAGSEHPTPSLAKSLPMLALPDKPSIAVLPFQNLSGDAEQEYFADGMVEDIIAALSRIRWLFVIARNSSFTYKGRAVDVREVGRQLGVRYVLEGSVRKAAGRVRISGELIDTAIGAHLWADRFDGAVEDIFDLQDQVAASVVGAIAPKLEQAEIARAKRKPTESLDAYDYFLRGMASIYRGTSEANDEALRHFSKAIKLDPDFATAYGTAAWCYSWRKINGWVTDRAQEIAEAERLARRAVELGKDDAVALARAGHALGFVVGDLDSGLAFVDRALATNSNLATAWYIGGWLRAYRGELDAAIEHFARAMRLSPMDFEIMRMQAGTAFAHLLACRHDEASAWAHTALRDQPSYVTALRILAASDALAGRMDKARQAMARLRQFDPNSRVSNLKELFPIRHPEHFKTWSHGLQKAGLPE